MTTKADTADTPTPATASPDVTADATAEMDSWDMATACLVGLYKARAKAQSELEAVRAANPGKLFAPGYGKAALITEALNDAIASFETDLRQVARSSALPMPDLQALRAKGVK